MTSAPIPSSTGMEPVRPCPFCASVEVERNSDKWGHFFVCECASRGAYGDTPTRALANWNARIGDVAQTDSDPFVEAMAIESAKWPADPLPAGDKGEATDGARISNWLADYSHDLMEEGDFDQEVEKLAEAAQWIADHLAAVKRASKAGGEKAIALLRWGTWYMTPAARLDWVKRAEAFLADQSVDVAYAGNDPVAAERARCIAICESWVGTFQDVEIKYTAPREYAIDAINDLVDLIRDGHSPVVPSTPREKYCTSDGRDYCTKATTRPCPRCPAMSSTHQPAPVQRPPHSSGERLPSSDAAGAGADTAHDSGCQSGDFGPCDCSLSSTQEKSL